MVTKTRGPLLEDYKRAIRAAKWAGWKAVRIEKDGVAFAILCDDTYVKQLAEGQPPAPDTESGGKPKLVW